MLVIQSVEEITAWSQEHLRKHLRKQSVIEHSRIKASAKWLNVNENREGPFGLLVHSSKVSVTVRRCISAHSMGNFYICEDTIRAEWYVQILEQRCHPDAFVFSCLCHSADITTARLLQNTYRVLLKEVVMQHAGKLVSVSAFFLKKCDVGIKLKLSIYFSKGNHIPLFSEILDFMLYYFSIKYEF